ncbi:MAG TPA: ATP-binding cassette domain-containing protein [Deltaproteobacteria bacterium]|nr:ATP-binding cassette domain-containing protein [Deltaproteobacteria bacterium]
MSDNKPLYVLSQVQHGYGREFNLSIPEFTIEKGSLIGFVGPNGCGKSTLLRILSFLEKPNNGSLFYEGNRVDNNYSALRNEVTLVMQEPYLLKRSVFENVAYGLRVRGEKKKLKDRVHETMECVGLDPGIFARRHWHELSGGEAQRVSIASRLILRPKVLLLDEPTASVDTQSASLIQKAVLDIRNRFETAIVIASHDKTWLNSITKTIVRIHNGRIVGSGTENIISGPWLTDRDSLWSTQIGGGEKIYSVKPPDKDAIAVLHPWDIIIATAQPSEISAQNILHGEISQMTTSAEDNRIQIEVMVSGTTLSCSVTLSAVESLSLMPGKNVFVIFKASSLIWQ